MKYLRLKIEILKSRAFRCQDDFAAHVGCHPSKLSMIIHGRRKPTPDESRRMAKALECKEEELFLEE